MKPGTLRVLPFLLAGAPALAASPSLMENLGRGVVAVRAGATDVFVGWRVLGTDPPDVSFNLYRATGGGDPVKLNAVPITGPTSVVDTSADLTAANAYFVRPIVYGIEQPPSAAFTLPAGAPVQPYLRVPLQVPPGGTTPVGEAFTYSPNDTSVGDLDGDGEYELVVKWDPTNSKDNSQSGYTGNVYLDAYRLDGTRLWRIDLGRNIRAGAHYTQLMVYDLDGDGRAEVACKTADGTVDGVGAVIGDPAADWRNSSGYVLAGPEYLTIFDGRNGAALATTSYVVPRGTVGDWGDTYGNRVDRFLAAIAYLDGQRPSLVTARGYYTRTVLAAWNWRDGVLSNVWTFDTGHTGTPNPYADWRGQGNHNLSVGDVDGDGRDEVTYGACAVDDDGTGLYSTGLGHGDALHMSDMDPDRPGLEVFEPHECPSCYGPNALEFRDARTGALIFGVQGTGDIGRGLALDVDPRYRGYEMWGSGPTGGMYTAQLASPNAILGPRGVQIAAGKPSINFGVWWDGDLLRELLDGTAITKWDWVAGATTGLLTPSGIASNNGTKANPALSADILGDWREEVVWRETGNDALRIYTTTIPTPHRLYTLMHDRQYRLAVAWQNTGYNQPPHPGFFLGDGMAAPPIPNIVTSLATLLGPPAPVFTTISDDTGASAADFVTSDTTLVISGTAQPLTTVTVTRFAVGVIGTAPADGAGNWSLDYTAVALPEGVVSFTATATDAGGATGAPSAPFSITIDTTPPGPPVIDTVSAESTLVFRGTADAGTTVEVTLAGTGVVASAVADAAGRWTASYAGPPLAPAAHSFTATAGDLAGNRSAPSAPVTVNTVVATPRIVAVSDDTGVSGDDGVTADATLVLSGTASAGDTVVISRSGAGVIGTSVADGGGAWSFDYTGTVLVDGAYTFQAAATGAAGTSPSSAPLPVTVDTVAPLVVSSSRVHPSAATSTSATATFRVTFSEAVAGVDAADFTPAFSGGLAGAVSEVSAAAGATIDVTVSPLTGEGSVRLDVMAGGISDVAGHPLAAPFSGGDTYTRLLAGNGTWIRSASGGLWSDNANWQEGIVGSGIGNTASFNAIEVEGDTAVHLDSPRTLGNLVFGDTDTASAAPWIVDDDGDPTNSLTLAVAAGSPTLTVNALGAGANVTLTASLAGASGLTKLGPGPLVLTRPNAVSGTLNISGGSVRLDAGASYDTGTGTVNVTVTPGSTLHVNGGSFRAGGLTTIGSGGGGGNAAGFFTLDSGTATFAGVRTNSEFGSSYRINGGTFTATDVNIRRNSAGTVDFNSGFIVAGGVASVGTIGIGTNNSNGAMTVSGGTLTATGTVTVGNQTSGGRGGALRVTGGRFVSTDPANGIVLSRRAGANGNNVASAVFTGGVTVAEKLTLGFDAGVDAGSATVTLNGGALYLGSGGVVRNGTGAFVTNLNFSSGILGAKASWSTSVPITLPAGGNLTLQAADESGLAGDLAFGGVLSGAGGFTKTGNGTVALTASNTFSGPVAVNGGALRVEGGVAAAGAFEVNEGGTLAGSGRVDRAVSLNAGGTLEPGGAAPGSTLTVSSLAWTGGGSLAVDLASGNQLVVTGALTRGGADSLVASLTASAPLAVGTAYTIATFATTDTAASDYAYTLPGHLGVFLVGPTSLQFLVTGAGPTAHYTHWAYLNGLPTGQDGPDQDPDGDGAPNLLEFVNATPPLATSVPRITATTVELEGVVYPAVRYARRRELGGVTAEVQASSSPGFTGLLESEEVSLSALDEATDEVVVRSRVPLAAAARQFFRVTAALSAPDSGPTTATSSPVGVMTTTLRRGLDGLAVPLIDPDLFVGVVSSNAGPVVRFSPTDGTLGGLLAADGRYYLEIVTGAFEGERFDLDTAATMVSGDSTLTLAFGADSFGTRPAPPDGALAGARAVLRPHLTLARLQSMLTPGLVGRDNAALADAVHVLEDGAFQRYSLRADGVSWRRSGSSTDFRHRVLPPDASFLVEAKSAAPAWLHAGSVRTNAFRKNLVSGFQAFASGFPLDVSPAEIGAFVDPSAPPETRWTGHNVFLFADQIQVILGDPPYQLFFLRGDGVTWRGLTSSSSVTDSPILGATRMIVLRRVRPDPGYRVAVPFTP